MVKLLYTSVALLSASGLLAVIYGLNWYGVDNREYRMNVRATKLRVTDAEFEKITNECSEYL